MNTDLIGDLLNTRLGAGGHHSAAALKDEWLTPPEILQALGRFDLDPCAPALERRPWNMADRHFTAEDNGLNMGWHGRVWCNPPYGQQTSRWLERCAAHGNAIALVFARTETRMFFDHVWPRADALLFLEGRLHFHHADGRRAAANSGAPSVLIAYGENNAHALHTCGLAGAFVPLRTTSALLEARAFIAAERQSFVECSTDPTTHQLDPDDYHHADQMTALLARIDAALGEGSKT